MKKIKLVIIILSFLLSILCHFMYDFFPNGLFSIFFPVNESIWEHMKLIATPTLILSIWEYFYYKKNNFSVNNFIFNYVISIVISIIIYLLIYIPFDLLFGHKALVAIILLFIIFFILQFINYYLSFRNTGNFRYIGIISLLLLYFLFGVLSYYPPLNFIFYDTSRDIYGIPN